MVDRKAFGPVHNAPKISRIKGYNSGSIRAFVGMPSLFPSEPKRLPHLISYEVQKVNSTSLRISTEELIQNKGIQFSARGNMTQD